MGYFMDTLRSEFKGTVTIDQSRNGGYILYFRWCAHSWIMQVSEHDLGQPYYILSELKKQVLAVFFKED